MRAENDSFCHFLFQNVHPVFALTSPKRHTRDVYRFAEFSPCPGTPPGTFTPSLALILFSLPPTVNPHRCVVCAVDLYSEPSLPRVKDKANGPPNQMTAKPVANL